MQELLSENLKDMHPLRTIDLSAAPMDRMGTRQTYKPSSVPRLNRGGDHLSSPDVTIGVKRPTRGNWPGVLMSSYLVLLRRGFACHRCHHRSGELLPRHFTLTPIHRGGMFLWHFPAPIAYTIGAWALPSLLPGGARTFLPPI